MQSPQQCRHSGEANRAEPHRLVVSGRNRKLERGAGVVPHTAVIRRGDAEPVLSWGEIGVKRLSASPHILPVAIVSL